MWRFRASTDSQVAEHTNEHENLALACMFAHSAKSKPANEMKFGKVQLHAIRESHLLV